MGENEQGGMLRTVVVVGLVALIAAVITMGVIGMKASLRSNTLMAVDAGRNLVALTDNSVKKSYKPFNYTQIIDNGDGSATLTFPNVDPNVKGLVFAGAGEDLHGYFKTGDKWRAEIDVKTTTPSALGWYTDSLHATGLGIESSDSHWVENPPFSTQWQHYVAEGTRGVEWGTYVVYFKNNTKTPITVDVKNMSLTRIG